MYCLSFVPALYRRCIIVRLVCMSTTDDLIELPEFLHRRSNRRGRCSDARYEYRITYTQLFSGHSWAYSTAWAMCNQVI